MTNAESDDLFRDNARPARSFPHFEAALIADDKSIRWYAVAAILVAAALFSLAGYIVWYSLARQGPFRMDEWAPIASCSGLGLALSVWGGRVLGGSTRWKDRYRTLVRESDPALVWLYRGTRKGYPTGAVHFAFDDGTRLLLLTRGPLAAMELIKELAHENAHFAIGLGYSTQKWIDYKKRYR